MAGDEPVGMYGLLPLEKGILYVKHAHIGARDPAARQRRGTMPSSACTLSIEARRELRARRRGETTALSRCSCERADSSRNATTFAGAVHPLLWHQMPAIPPANAPTYLANQRTHLNGSMPLAPVVITLGHSYPSGTECGLGMFKLT